MITTLIFEHDKTSMLNEIEQVIKIPTRQSYPFTQFFNSVVTSIRQNN